MKPTAAAPDKADAGYPQPPGTIIAGIDYSRCNTADVDTSTNTASSVFINPALLTISPQRYELEFWQSRRVTHQLMTVDRTAFVMSTLNIYSGKGLA